jgi:hypothetical protein
MTCVQTWALLMSRERQSGPWPDQTVAKSNRIVIIKYDKYIFKNSRRLFFYEIETY